MSSSSEAGQGSFCIRTAGTRFFASVVGFMGFMGLGAQGGMRTPLNPKLLNPKPYFWRTCRLLIDAPCDLLVGASGFLVVWI